jgi:hypothetical protein
VSATCLISPSPGSRAESVGAAVARPDSYSASCLLCRPGPLRFWGMARIARDYGYTLDDCLAAINFALQGDPRDYDTDAETITFDVSVAPAA